jgi:hypothetical protein
MFQYQRIASLAYNPAGNWSASGRDTKSAASLVLIIVYAGITTLTFKGSPISDDLLRDTFLYAAIFAGKVFGALLGVVIFAYLLNAISSFFGEGDVTNELRFAIPCAWTPLIIPELIKMFPLAAFTAPYLSVTCYLWNLFILIRMVSIIRQISLWKSLVSVLITIFVIILPVAAVLWFFPDTISVILQQM